ncbi:MAG: acylphosphatase [Chlorobiaceae bacterium]|nr:acylphosphatase [Chlorobiaceae bacterium]
MEKRITARVKGLVQGVGFRMFIVREASSRNLSGWTRNLPDGSVEIEAQGPSGLVDELVSMAHVGPSRSHVTSVTVRETPVEPDAKGFRFLY